MPTKCYRFVTVLSRFCPFLLFFDIFSRDRFHFSGNLRIKIKGEKQKGVSCPASLKDGYAVVSADLENASEDRPAKLRVCGRSVAGCNTDVTVESGTAVKIMTGARIPGGANTVIANEFTREKDGWVLCYRDAGPGRNIIEQGHDVMKGKPIASCGEVLTPAKTGLLVAGGISVVRVHPQPRIGIIAVGDEVVSPGKAAQAGSTLRQQSCYTALVAQTFPNGGRSCHSRGSD